MSRIIASSAELRHRWAFIKYAAHKVKCFSINITGTGLEILHVQRLTMAAYVEVDWVLGLQSGSPPSLSPLDLEDKLRGLFFHYVNQRRRHMHHHYWTGKRKHPDIDVKFWVWAVAGHIFLGQSKIIQQLALFISLVNMLLYMFYGGGGVSWCRFISQQQPDYKAASMCKNKWQTKVIQVCFL